MTTSRPVRDISRWLTPGHPNWPGDAPFSVEPTARISEGSSVNLGALSTSTHTGTHVDAPWHYSDSGARLHEVPVSRYVGRARVMHVTGHSTLPASVLDGLKQLPERLLLYTGQPEHWSRFPRDFTAISPEFVQAASRLGVRLIGTDAPSVDPLESKTLDGHAACLAADILIVVGLNLVGVPEGEYEFVCLGLPLHGQDGAPARAVLIGDPA